MKAISSRHVKIRLYSRFVKSALFVLVVALIVAFPFLARTRSYPLTVVEGNSMDPALQNGDLVYYIGSEQIENGSIIVFNQDNSGNPWLAGITAPVVVHRIVDVIVLDDGLMQYRTRGDNNKFDDTGLVRNHQVLGVLSVVVPKVGLVFMFLKSPQGLVASIGFVVVFYLTIYESKVSHDKKKAAFLGLLAQKKLNGEISEKLYNSFELATGNLDHIDSKQVGNADGRAIVDWLKSSIGSMCKISDVECGLCHGRSVVFEGQTHTLVCHKGYCGTKMAGFLYLKNRKTKLY